MRFILFALVAVLHAQTPVAVVNGQAALVSTVEGKRAFEQLKAKVEAKKKEFEARQNEIGQIEEQLGKGAPVMAGDRREQLANSLNDKKKRLQRDLQDADEETQRDQQQAFQPLEDKVSAIISKFAAEKGYSLVIDISMPGSPVRYAATGTDITKEVVALYDKTYAK